MLKNRLKDYLSEIPKDPQKNNMIEIHYDWQRAGKQEKVSKSHRIYTRWTKTLSSGEYLYQIAQHKNNNK